MYSSLKQTLDSQAVTLVAVSKTKPHSALMELYDKGQRVFGENRVQELVEKQEALPKDIEWHMIGALQKNKVKYLAPFVTMIQSLDSLALARIINKEAAKNERTIPVLLQIKIGTEDSKSGYSIDLLKTELPEIMTLGNINICGVMGIGTFTHDEEVTLMEFRTLKSYFSELKESAFTESENFKEISMGMSGDYQLAIEEGSTMVRIGSLLFGSR